MLKIVWLKGDYIGKRVRQKQAEKMGCEFVISFHFNSASDPDAGGCEIYFNKHCTEHMLEHLRRIGQQLAKDLGVTWRGLKPAEERASFMNFYPCPAILLEPLFISNPEEAKLLHEISEMRRVFGNLAKNLFKFFLDVVEAKVIGLDIGHAFKSKSDNGARCVAEPGCWEAKHNEQVAKIVAFVLQYLSEELGAR